MEKDREIGVETAPNQTTFEKLGILKQAGVTRVSMGIQSFSDEELEEELKDIAKGYNTDLERVKQIVPSSEVSHGIAMNKALDMIRESSRKFEVSPEKTAD